MSVFLPLARGSFKIRHGLAQLPGSAGLAIGERYEGFSNERWLDIRHFRDFAKPLERRFAICKRKGFDPVEPDNLAGWENRTDFKVSRASRRVRAQGPLPQPWRPC